MPQLASEQTCVGCLACIDVCPKTAVRQVIASDGHIYINIDSTICIECKACERVCVGLNANEYGSMNPISHPFSAYTINDDDYDKATSGGIFPAVAKHIISRGGVVYGASYNSNEVRHVRVDREEDLCLLQGSKYIQSNLDGVYKLIKHDLDSQTQVLFTGTGCQVAAVLTFFSKYKNKNLLYTMDLICGGVPSRLLLDKFICNTKDFHSVISFRQKDKYIFSYVGDNGAVNRLTKALPLDGFKSMLTNRYSCYDCQFVGIHRKSDWTIGDYWGDLDYKSKVKSVCICHNERAGIILKELKDTIISELPDWNFIVFNPRVVNGKAPMGSRLERVHLGVIMRYFPYKIIEKIYGSNVKTKDVIWFLYKVYKYVRYKQYAMSSKRRVYSLLNKIKNTV